MLAPSEPPAVLGIAAGQLLGPMTTLEVGGPARYFGAPRDEATLIAMIHWGRACQAPLVVLGGGSNIVISDAGLQALVIRPHLTDLGTWEKGDRVLLDAGAGICWDALAKHAAECGLWGLECLSGIPGSVGATPIQNVGAYGHEVGEYIDPEAFPSEQDTTPMQVGDYLDPDSDFTGD